jgi:DNA-binding response OmpR family regulator
MRKRKNTVFPRVKYKICLISFQGRSLYDEDMKKKILVVEDEEVLTFLYEEELKADGYDILTARNGKEAVKQLEEGKPDLVVLDIVMPVMDGMEALGRILGRGREIPVILHTSHEHYKDDLMSWAADAYVIKSSNLSELKATIRELLAKRESQ